MAVSHTNKWWKRNQNQAQPTSGVGERGLHCLPAVPAACVVVREALIAGSCHQLQVLGHVFDDPQRLDLEHLPAAGVGEVDGAAHRVGGQVVLVSWAVAERQREQERKDETPLTTSLEGTIKKQKEQTQKSLREGNGHN